MALLSCTLPEACQHSKSDVCCHTRSQADVPAPATVHAAPRSNICAVLLPYIHVPTLPLCLYLQNSTGQCNLRLGSTLETLTPAPPSGSLFVQLFLCCFNFTFSFDVFAACRSRRSPSTGQ